MSLSKNIDQAFLQAMRDKNQDVLSVLRMLKSAIKNKSIEMMGKELTEDDIIATVKSEIKKRKDSAEAYKQGLRQDLVDKELAEVKVLEEYMPEQLSLEEVKIKVQEVIAELAEEDKTNFGKVMRSVMEALKGQADGSVVGQAVKEILG